MKDDDRIELSKELRHTENPVWNASPAIGEAFRSLGECTARWTAPPARVAYDRAVEPP